MSFCLISILMYLVQNISNKQFSKKCKTKSSGTSLIQNGFCVLSSALFLIIFSKPEFMSLKLTVFSLIFGIMYLLTVFLLLKAFTLGSMGASTLFCNAGIFVSSFYGVLRFNDEFTMHIALGMALLFIAMFLSGPQEINSKKGGLKWFLAALGSGVSNGIVASIKREAVTIYPNGVKNFLLWGFFFAAITAFVILLFSKNNRNDAKAVIKQPPLILCGVLAGVGTASANLFQMLALKHVSSAIIYPLTSGFLVTSLWFISYAFYKETRLTHKNIASVILCVISIILVNIK